MPKVSVITAYYNRAHVLRRTIESVLSQTYTDIELIVVDDRSTDDTADRLSELASEFQDPRLRIVINEQNKGLVQTLRDSIADSTGEYIAIQGSGDVSLPDRIARQVELLDAQPGVVAVGCWYRNVDELSGEAEDFRPDASASTNGITTFTHGEMTMRRSAYESSGGYRAEFEVGQLTDLGFRLYRIGTFATVPEFLYERHLQGDGVTYNPDKLVKQAQFLTFAHHLKELSDDATEVSLAAVRNGGVGAVIPIENNDVQAILTERSLRLCLYGRGADAAVIAGRLTRPMKRYVFQALARGMQTPFSRPLRWVLRATMRARRVVRARWTRSK